MLFQLHGPAEASLVSARNEEISRVSICPEFPSVMILDSPESTILSDFLRHDSEFVNYYQLIDRDQLGEPHSACRATARETVFVDDVFAMYIISLEYDAKISPAVLFRLMRTDTGAVIYEKQSTIGQDFPDLASFIRSTTPQWLAILAKQHNECLNEFTATITEDVQQVCHGQFPTATEFDITSDIRLVFTIPSLNLSKRGLTQHLRGSVLLQPKPVQTLQRLALSQTMDACDSSEVSQKILNINLQEKKLPAILQLTIPQDLSKTWLFSPRVDVKEPLFTGDALETNTVTTHNSGNCLESSRVKKIVTQYTFLGHNFFKFTPQQFKPLCTANHFVQPPYIRAPNLGTPVAVDITRGCTGSSLSANVTFLRKFYRD